MTKTRAEGKTNHKRHTRRGRSDRRGEERKPQNRGEGDERGAETWEGES
jgi:hypothetical protein